MRRANISFWDGCATGIQEDKRQNDGQAQPGQGVSSVVWSRLVKGEGITQQPWHYRLQLIRLQ